MWSILPCGTTQNLVSLTSVSTTYSNENRCSHGFLLPCTKATPSHLGLQSFIRLIIGFILQIALHKYWLEMITMDHLGFESRSPAPKAAMLPLCLAPLIFFLKLDLNQLFCAFHWKNLAFKKTCMRYTRYRYHTLVQVLNQMAPFPSLFYSDFLKWNIWAKGKFS